MERSWLAVRTDALARRRLACSQVLARCCCASAKWICAQSCRRVGRRRCTAPNLRAQPIEERTVGLREAGKRLSIAPAAVCAVWLLVPLARHNLQFSASGCEENHVLASTPFLCLVRMKPMLLSVALPAPPVPACTTCICTPRPGPSIRPAVCAVSAQVCACLRLSAPDACPCAYRSGCGFFPSRYAEQCVDRRFSTGSVVANHAGV